MTDLLKTKPVNCEGVEVTARVRIGHVDILHTTHVMWIKGKWNELTKGDRYDIYANERTGEHFLKFRNPKQADTGLYRVKAVSQNGEEEYSFELKVGRMYRTNYTTSNALAIIPNLVSHAWIP